MRTKRRVCELIFLLMLIGVCSAGKSKLAVNISRLLDKLLTNYSKSMRPSHVSGKPTIITTNININSLGPISNFEMSYTMDCYFRQEWRDERLAFDASISQISLSMKMLELIWKPDTYFLNGKESYLHKIPTSNRLVRLFKDGRVLYSSRLTIKADCPMDLRDFPLDKQICPLWIGSYSYSADEVEYRWKTKVDNPHWKPIQIDDGVKLSQFDLLGTSWNKTDFHQQSKFIYQSIGMNIFLRRHMGYYMLQVYIPGIMLVILSWVAFFINREATADRTSIGIMCVLSLATLSLDTRNDIPNVPYTTALDFFLIMCYLFLFASLIEFTAVHYFTKVGYGDIQNISLDEQETETDEKKSTSALADSEDKQYSIRRYLRDVWKCVLNDFRFKKEMTKRAHFKGINSVSRCDRFARIIFPTTFLIFNIFYWYTFYKFI